MLLQIFYVGKASEYTSEYKAWLTLLFLWNPSSFFGSPFLSFSMYFTPHCWGFLASLRSLPTIYTFHQSLEQMHWFLKCKAGLFLRPLRSKDDQGWILRLQPRNFVIISESLPANLKKVRQTSVWQTIPKFWFICLFYCSSKTYSCKQCK